MTERWIRTCQECGNEQEDEAPTYGEEPSDAYNERQCRKCKSRGSLDYGSTFFYNEHGDRVSGAYETEE